MAMGLEDGLQSLHTLLEPGNEQANREQIEIIVEDIKQNFQQDIACNKIDFVCSQIFDKEKGLLSFLQKIAGVKELKNGKTTALILLSELVQKVGKKVLPYAIDIKEACLSVYSRDDYAKVKVAAIPVLIKLLELTAGSTMGQELNIDKLIQKFFLELTKTSKLSATVKASIYHLLGVTAEVFPEVMAPYSYRLAHLYVGALKAEMTSKSKKAEMSVVTGCLDGLTAFMFNFNQSAEEESENSYEIFKYTRMALDPTIDYTRYDVPKAGLKLITRHAGQFRQFLMDEYKPMYEKLQKWSHHPNRDVLHLGLEALEAFTKEISEGLVDRAREGHKEGAIFKFFLLEYRHIMNDKFSSSKEIAMAIKGYGLLAAPCRTFLSESDTQMMFGEMVSKCEHQFFGNVEDLEEKLISLPSYLTALANIILQVDSVSLPYGLVLERLMVLLIENMPHVYRPQQVHFYKSLLMLLLTLMRKGSIFHQTLSSVVYQGLIRTCSHPVLADVTQVEEDESGVKVISYKDYINLWTGLLGSAQMKDSTAAEFTIGERTKLTESIYSELMTAILKMLAKLDFETRTSETVSAAGEGVGQEENENLSADPVFGNMANRPKDFQVFINLVDFCREFLEQVQWQLFEGWVFTLVHSLIIMSTRYPVVSGFYKMLSMSLHIASKLKYFKDFQSDNVESNSVVAMELDEHNEENLSEKLATYQLINKFSKEVLVRMKQYRDELLASCLTLILSLPKEVIANQMSQVVPAIQTTLTIGLSYLPLANVGLDALECWSKELPPSLMRAQYHEILPYLDAYLRTADTGSDDASTEPAVVIESKTAAKAKAPVRLVKEKKSAEIGSESQLTKIKLRILRYLGSLGGQINHTLLARAEEDMSKEAIAWDTQKHLKFAVPFYDMKPVIYFDPFLPHVVQLAQQASDRQTKVAACELLHSLVLYALGRGAQMPGETQIKSPMEQLYHRLFPALLTLACDVEQVCKDLFEPLVLQLIHWFTNNKMAESPETMALLDSIFDGLIQATNTALRDLSAKCLKEFLKWSLKQISKKAAEKNPINAKSVLKRIYSYSLHPNAFKRLGAALAFNNIYTVFREEDSLVDRFTFEVLEHMVESLSIAHGDDKSLGTQEQCVKALEHLERIIKAKVEILKKDPGPKIRPEPRAWSSRKLEVAVRWLTRQCGNPQTECRHACMKLVYNLCTLLPGVKSSSDFFAIILKAEGPGYFLKRFEGGGQAASEKHGLQAHPTLTHMAQTFSLPAARQWFEFFLSALDCYCWLFGQNLMAPSQIFDGQGSDRSCLFESLNYFLEKLAFSSIGDAAKLFPWKHPTVFTPWEKEEYNRLKCTVVIRVWNFLNVLLVSEPKIVPAQVWCENLWRLVCDCVVKPSAVGFNMADTEVMLQLPAEMSQVLEVLKRHLPAKEHEQMKMCLTRQLAGNCDLKTLLPINLTSPENDHVMLQQMVEGYKQLDSAGLLTDHLPCRADTSQFAMALFDNVFKGVTAGEGKDLRCVSLSPPALKLAHALLSLALQLGVAPKVLVNKLLDKTKVQGVSTGVNVGHGEHFFSVMKATIAAHLVRSGAGVVEALMSDAGRDPGCVGVVLVACLEHGAKDRVLRKREGMSLCKTVLNNWSSMQSWWGDGATSDSKSLSLLVLTKLLLIDSTCATDTSNKSFPVLFGMYLSMVKDTSTSMNFKTQVLRLLPFFATLTGAHEEGLRDALNRFIADHFPLKSSEFPPGTPKLKDYITSIDMILNALELTGSLMLLEILISVFCREQHHVHEDAIQMGINRFVQRLPLDGQSPALDVPLSIFTKEESYPPDVRRAAVERVCLPMLRLLPVATVKEFFKHQIHRLTSHLDVKLSKICERDLESQLTNKICCFQLLEVMYVRLSKDEVNTKASVVNREFCLGKDETGKEMTQKITKCANDAKSEDARGETMCADLRRQYHCYAYNLLMAIISCVQTDPKFYKGFLFQDNIAKGQFLLDNVIDQEFVFDFQVELQSPHERRKKFVAVRRQESEKQTEGGSVESSVSPSIHIATQYLADSSLSDDLNLYDFNMSAAGQGGSFGQAMKRVPSHTTSGETTRSEAPDNYVELEMDQLNKHECMASLVALIQHMVNNNIFPQVTKGTVPNEMPAWMVYLHGKLSNVSTHISIQIFVAKLVMNCGQIFQSYARFWLRPLCQLLLTPEVSRGGLNYFVVDLLITMATWHTTAIPAETTDERAMASCVVRFIIEHIYHPVRSIFRNNLELLKTLLDCWHPRVDLPYDIIYSLLKVTEPKSQQPCTGVQVLGVVLASKLPPYGPSAPVDQDRYLSVLAGLMNHSLKLVYAATAEVVGLILHLRASTQQETEGFFHDTVQAQLTGLANSKLDNFIVCIHGIHKSYPPLTQRFLRKLLYLLPKLHGGFKAQCLEVLLSHVDSLEDVFMEVSSMGVNDLLKHRDEDIQLVSLKIIRGVMSRFKGPELMSILPSITAFSSHSSSACRKIMLDILMWIYDNYRDYQEQDSEQIMMLTKENLLLGLCDQDMACRLICQNFWSSNTRLPEGTLERTVSMLQAMYSPQTEPHYLAYATNLLMEATSKSPDYQREIFEHALSECTFQDYSVHSSWRQRHAVMTPLFASTQVSQSMDEGTDSLDGGVRATQDVPQFTPTLDISGSVKAFNWLTQSSFDTFTEASSIGGSTQLLYRLAENPLRSDSKGQRAEAARGQAPTVMKTMRLNTSGDSKQAVDEPAGQPESLNDVWRLRRRFIKDKTSQSLSFARRNIRLKQLREEAQKEQKARREHQVTLYRKYRIGELPDIQIKYQYLIAPLQALAHRDSTIARLLFSSLFQAIFKEMDKLKTQREVEALTDQINRSIETILKETIHYYPPFMASIFTIVYDLRSSLKVAAGDLGTCAITSNQQTMGIMVLEEQLIQSDSRLTASSSKRARQLSAVQSADTAQWIQLSRLYKSIHEYDVIQGIFASKLGTKDLTRKAIESEARGDFKAAHLLYEEALGKLNWSEDPLEAEIDFWDESRMECLDHLAQWKDLEAISSKGIDNSDSPNLERVWEDGFYQEHYLPYVVRSKLKLMLSGDPNQQLLLTFVDDSMRDPHKKQILQSRYSTELALMYLWQQSYDRARHYSSMAYDSFLQSWSSTTTLMLTTRANNLHKLQPLLELHEFLDHLSSQGKSPSSLIKAWGSRVPHNILDPVMVWDDVVTNRTVYLNQLIEGLTGDLNNTGNEENFIEKMEEMKIWLRLKMANSCREQGNSTLTLRILRDTQRLCKQAANKSLMIEWSHLYTTAHHTKACNSVTPWADNTFTDVLTTLDLLNKTQSNPALKERPDLGVRHHILVGKGYSILVQGLFSLPELSALSEGTKKKMAALAGTADIGSQLVGQLLSKGFEAMKSAVGQDSELTAPQKARQSMTAEEANLELSKFCDQYLHMQEDMEQFPESCDVDAFPETLVVCLLNAMRGGEEEARERFPRLLQIAENFPQVRDVFLKKVSEVPSWMFLMWISQMTALLDKEEASIVAPLLTRIATEYPQALIYPLRMSSEGFVFKSTPQDKRKKERIDKLVELTDNPLVNKFIQALEQFGQPDVIFGDWCKDVKQLLTRQSSRKEIEKKYQELCQDLLDVPAATSNTLSSYSSASVGMGEYRKRFATNFKSEFEKIFGTNVTKLCQMDPKEFQQAESKLRNCLAKPKEPPTKLKDYCPWLAEFNHNKYGRDLEIPGQYTGQRKPTPEYHVKISGFDERVLVMSSLRKPKRIMIRGNDERDYPYLVKSGEDLRLDQRIETLYFIMNKVMNSDPACRQRKLHLTTYQVISMTPRVGLIEWMKDTQPLKNFLLESLTDEERNYLLSEQGPNKQNLRWLTKLVNKGDQGRWQKIYDELFIKYSLTETVSEFRQKEGKVPWDLSRRAIHKMSTSPEAFHVLRSTMLTSHAVICICQYLLGIGDRHLSNFMVNLKTGHMIGIDFGHSFGSATQFLPVPELIPFRLTRQLTNLNLPLHVKGQMESAMRHVLRALRLNSDLLLSTMDVFVKEPNLDWLNFAEKQMQENKEPAEAESDDQWYPKQKIQFAQRKLKGDHPCYIMQDELHLGHSRRAAYKYMLKVLMGDKQDNLRAKLPPHDLSVEDQVAALIDQATDPNILGRTWMGWEPWF